VDPVVSSPVSPVSGLVFEQLWSQVRHGLAVVGWVIFLGLVAAAGCWCCGYVVRSDLLRARPPARRRRLEASLQSRDDDEITEEAARGIREIEWYLSTV
jgi:hypothetical protein